MIGGALWVPQAHRQFLCETLRHSVVALSSMEHSKHPGIGGGTGFHVIAPSGQVYIMTNRHVCVDVAVDGKLWGYVEGETADHELKVILISDSFDLCLVEPIPGQPGLTIGTKPAMGQRIYYFGHPRMQQNTLVEGDAIGYEEIDVLMGVIDKGILEANCKNKDSVIKEESEMNVFLEGLKSDTAMPFSLEALVADSIMLKVCYEKDTALITTMMIYGGASGSPMVDSFGRVIGVVYAAPINGGWGYGVTMIDVNTILTGR
jgi:hypothetical protein